jgi:tetrapyrrole methylase family protein/MazG family protein/ATP diphosphatase
MSVTGKEFENLMQLIARLRAENGCPWDREQTPATIKRYLLEEAYEVVDAVDQRDSDQVADELGDLIFMAIFLGYLYEEQDELEMTQILRRAGEKMVRRHPHVFGDRKVDSARQVKLNWEEIKQQERPAKPLGARLNDIPRAIPPLMRSYRTISRLGRALRRPLNHEAVVSELRQTFSALLHPKFKSDEAPSAALLGKLLLLIVAFSFSADVRAEEALTESLKNFCHHVKRLEAILAEKGKDWQDLSEEEEQSLWKII